MFFKAAVDFAASFSITGCPLLWQPHSCCALLDSHPAGEAETQTKSLIHFFFILQIVCETPTSVKIAVCENKTE